LKVARYRYGNEENYGVINQQAVLSLPGLAKRFKKELPQKIEGFIAQGNETIETAEDLIKNANNSDIESVSAPLSAVSLLAPISFPPNIICLGLNYFDHAAETNPPSQTSRESSSNPTPQ